MKYPRTSLGTLSQTCLQVCPASTVCQSVPPLVAQASWAATGMTESSRLRARTSVHDLPRSGLISRTVLPGETSPAHEIQIAGAALAPWHCHQLEGGSRVVCQCAPPSLERNASEYRGGSTPFGMKTAPGARA